MSLKMSKDKTTPLYTAKRGWKDSDEKNKNVVEDYSGVFHRNIFRVDYPITLEGLSFFGPTKIEGDSAVYHVEWEICKSIKPTYYFWFFPFMKSNVENPILASGSQCVEVKKDEVAFQLPLNKIYIPANEGIEIAFVLNGPKTARMKTPSHSVPVKTRNRVVEFSFNEGSMQMPELYFTMEEDIEPV